MTTTHLVIEPSRGWMPLRLRDLWAYRELVYFLAWRDVKVRYKQTTLGIAWAVLQPFMTMVVFSIFFGALAKIPSDGMPYPIFAFAALVPWTFFANSVSAASASLVGNAALVTKIYFPRLVVPLAGVIATFVDFLCGLVVFAGVAMYFGQRPSAQLVFLPLFILLTMATALGVGLWLAALNVRYRDVRYIVPYVLQFWFFATPVAYPSSLVPEPWRLWYAINPMVGVIDGFRAALVSGPAIRPGSLVISAITSAIMLAGGVLYFRRIERTLADIV